MHSGVRFTITVAKALADKLVDETRSPAERGALLSDALTSNTRWYSEPVRRRGWQPVAVRVLMPSTAATFLTTATTSRYRRTILKACGCFDCWLFVDAKVADLDAPAAEICGVAIDLVRQAEASRDELLEAWSADTRITLVTAPALAEAS